MCPIICHYQLIFLSLHNQIKLAFIIKKNEQKNEMNLNQNRTHKNTYIDVNQMDKTSPNNMLGTNQTKQFTYGQKIINKKYTILYKIADESHSQVYSLSTNKNNKEVVRAIKFENQNVEFPQISNEVSIIRKIFQQNEFEVGFPRLYEFGSTENQNYMITKLLGPNLAELHKLCNNRFNPVTCLLVGLQILDRLEKIHQLGYVYRDIKLNNFCIGLGSESSFIYMVDFGHCERFRNKETGSHIPYKEGNSNLQEAMFMSINVHNNVHYTRRDDIESLLYLIIHMFKARLPWRKVDAKSKKQKDEKIGEMKKAVSPSYLSNNFGLEMADLLWYIRSVNYYQKPDYDFIRHKLYAMIMTKTNLQELQIKYDWNERQEMDYTIYTGEPKMYLRKADDEKNDEQSQVNQIDEMLRTQKTKQNDDEPLI